MKKIFLLLLVLPLVFAQTLTSKFVEYPEYITPATLAQSTIEAKLAVQLDTGNYQIIDPRLYVYVLSGDGRILYTENNYINLQNGTNTFTLYIPGTELASKLEQDDGFIIIKAVVSVVLSNGTNIESLNSTATARIYIKNNVENGDIDVLYIAPDLTKYSEFDRRVYLFYIGLKNDGAQRADNVKVYLDVYDQYGVRKLRYNTIVSIDPLRTQEVRFGVNFGMLNPGYYKIQIKVYKGDLLVFSRTYNISVALYQLSALKILKEEIIPPKYKAGDLVLIKLLLKNSIDKPLIVKPELVSEDLNLYRSLSSFKIDAFGTKEFKVVIPIPKNIEPGEHYVTIKFNYNGYITQSYKVKLEIPGEKKISTTSILSAELYIPSAMKIGENYTGQLVITTHVEDLIPIQIKVESKNARVYLPKEQLLVGGEGLSKTIDLKIEPENAGEGYINVTVIDLNTGKIVAEVSKVFTVAGQSKEAVTTKTATIDVKKAVLLLIGAALIIIAIWLAGRKKEEEEERPSE